MVIRHTIHLGLIGVLLSIGASTSSQAGETRPIVVELFTSQGCSSCPPANANLIELARRSDVLALSYSVTYWDYLGWKDLFGKEAFTDRQVTYEPALGERGPFTPQMVVNGRVSTVGNRLSEVEGIVEQEEPAAGPDIALTARSVTIGSGQAPTDGADVWLVRYDPKLIEVPVSRGENTGHTLPHTHVVHELARLGAWDGAAMRLKLPAKASELRTAILVQGRNGGPILAAATD